jgi:hypothetical protein
MAEYSGHGEADESAERLLLSLNPGDALDVWVEGHRVVTTVFHCREEFEGRVYTWRWIFLDDESIIELSPDGCFRYREHQIARQGDGFYESLVAQDGILVRFESHVRAGEAAQRPVHVTIGDREFRVSSTGSVAVERRGDAPPLLPWQSFSTAPDQNVYFGLVDVDDEDRVGLGLWTTNVCISLGAVFDPSDIVEVFPGNGRPH